MIDFSFVSGAVHRRLLQQTLNELRDDDRVIGALLTGSLARGDAYPDSDIDLYALVRHGMPKEFHAEIRDGILIQRLVPLLADSSL